MEFHRFEVTIDDTLAKDILLRLNGDLIEAKWFTMQELSTVKQVPGGKEFFQQLRYI